MNTLRAIRIDESQDLTGFAEKHTYLVLGTDAGHEVRIRIGDEDLQRVINALAGGSLDPDAEAEEAQHPVRHPRVAPESAPFVPPTPTPREVPPGDAPLTQEEAENTPIPWNELDDGVLSPVMKAAFFKLRAPMLLSPRAIMSLVDDITEKFTAQDWKDVVGPGMGEVAQPAEPPPPQPRAPSRAQWADGSPMMPGSVSGRTVPKDEMGYPVVEGEVDPGEIVGRGSEVDEDGVGQL